MRNSEFSAWLETQPVNDRTRAHRVRAVARIEAAYDCDLDDAYDTDGLSGLLDNFLYSNQDRARDLPNPTRMNIQSGDIQSQINWYRTQINSYRKFREAEESGFSAELAMDEDNAECDAQTFGLEADLETALRGTLSQLEDGLHLADGGQQRKVASGFIDILARDKDGLPVVIELKAGQTRPEAVAQVLGYMADIAAEENCDVRGYLIGSDHHPRVEAAARAVPNLQLRSYAYQFTFV